MDIARIASRMAALAYVTFAIAACGSGGSNNPPNNPPPPPPAEPTAQERERAQNAKVRMRLADGQVSMTWLDVASNETNYLIERRLDNGSWTTEWTLPPQDVRALWMRDLNGFAAGTYRVTAVFNGYTLQLSTAPGETEISVDPAARPVLQIGAPNLDDSVPVSVTNASSALAVTYALAGVPVVKATGGGAFAATLPARHLVESARQVTAEVQQNVALTVQASETLLTSHSRPAVLLQVGPALSQANSVQLKALTSSGAGVASVALFVNGSPLRVLTTPRFLNDFHHVIDAATLPPGTNTFRAVATDENAETASMEVEYTLDGPALNVEGVYDGMIVNGPNLTARGTFGNNDGSTLLHVTLDGYTLARTRTSPFSIDRELNIWEPGEHTLRFRAENASGTWRDLTYLINIPPPGRAVEFIASDVMHLLAASEGALLYRKSSGDVILRNAAGVETPVVGPPGKDFYQWWLTNGYVVAQERNNRHVHVLTAPGQSIDLHATNAPSFGLPYAHGDWLSLIASSGPGFTAYYLPGGDSAFMDVNIPGHTATSSRHAFIPEPTNESFVFSGVVNGTAGIHRHRVFAGTTERLVTGSFNYLRIDQTRLAVSDGTTLRSSTWADPTALTTLGQHEGDFYLEDGLLLWQDPEGRVQVNDGSTTTQLTSGWSSIWDDYIDDGKVVFFDAGRLYSWSPAGGKQALWMSGASVLHTQGVVYLMNGYGVDGSLHRMTLP